LYIQVFLGTHYIVRENHIIFLQTTKKQHENFVFFKKNI
jgi:hypothetical protein